MGQKWQDTGELARRYGAFEAIEEEVRTLEWVEIAGLIEIDSDGSWRPSSFGKAHLMSRESDQVGAHPN
jgi:hypothetical protein